MSDELMVKLTVQFKKNLSTFERIFEKVLSTPFSFSFSFFSRATHHIYFIHTFLIQTCFFLCTQRVQKVRAHLKHTSLRLGIMEYSYIHMNDPTEISQQ